MTNSPAVRDLVLELDGYQCKLQYDCCTVTATTAYRFPGGVDDDDITHLMAACEPCQLPVAAAAANPDAPPEPRTQW